MDAPPRAHIFLLLAVLAITAVLYSGAPRRFSWPPFVTGSLPIPTFLARHQYSTPALAL